jgi:hypothetical protein
LKELLGVVLGLVWVEEESDIALVLQVLDADSVEEAYTLEQVKAVARYIVGIVFLEAVVLALFQASYP